LIKFKKFEAANEFSTKRKIYAKCFIGAIQASKISKRQKHILCSVFLMKFFMNKTNDAENVNMKQICGFDFRLEIQKADESIR